MHNKIIKWFVVEITRNFCNVFYLLEFPIFFQLIYWENLFHTVQMWTVWRKNWNVCLNRSTDTCELIVKTSQQTLFGKKSALKRIGRRRGRRCCCNSRAMERYALCLFILAVEKQRAHAQDIPSIRVDAPLHSMRYIRSHPHQPTKAINATKSLRLYCSCCCHYCFFCYRCRYRCIRTDDYTRWSDMCVIENWYVTKRKFPFRFFS